MPVAETSIDFGELTSGLLAGARFRNLQQETNLSEVRRRALEQEIAHSEEMHGLDITHASLLNQNLNTQNEIEQLQKQLTAAAVGDIPNTKKRSTLATEQAQTNLDKSKVDLGRSRAETLQSQLGVGRDVGVGLGSLTKDPTAEDIALQTKALTDALGIKDDSAKALWGGQIAQGVEAAKAKRDENNAAIGTHIAQTFQSGALALESMSRTASNLANMEVQQPGTIEAYAATAPEDLHTKQIVAMAQGAVSKKGALAEKPGAFATEAGKKLADQYSEAKNSLIEDQSRLAELQAGGEPSKEFTGTFTSTTTARANEIKATQARIAKNTKRVEELKATGEALMGDKKPQAVASSTNKPVKLVDDFIAANGGIPPDADDEYLRKVSVALKAKGYTADVAYLRQLRDRQKGK